MQSRSLVDVLLGILQPLGLLGLLGLSHFDWVLRGGVRRLIGFIGFCRAFVVKKPSTHLYYRFVALCWGSLLGQQSCIGDALWKGCGKTPSKQRIYDVED